MRPLKAPPRPRCGHPRDRRHLRVIAGWMVADEIVQLLAGAHVVVSHDVVHSPSRIENVGELLFEGHPQFQVADDNQAPPAPGIGFPKYKGGGPKSSGDRHRTGWFAGHSKHPKKHQRATRANGWPRLSGASA